jgi:hypothetical protein
MVAKVLLTELLQHCAYEFWRQDGQEISTRHFAASAGSQLT